MMLQRTPQPSPLNGRQRVGRSPTRPLRVLLVEDDDAQARIFEYAAQAVGAAVDLRHAGDGVAAMAMIRDGMHPGAQRINLVLLDLQLPPEGGLAVLEAIKADALLRVTPVVVLSSSRLQADRQAAYARHANGYVVKPGSFDDLERLTHDLLIYWSHWNEPVEEA